MVIEHKGVWKNGICMVHQSEFHRSKPKPIPCECCLKRAAHHLKIILTPEEVIAATEGADLILEQFGIEGISPNRLLELNELSRMSP